MSEYLTFGTGMLVASLFWFALFTYFVVKFSTNVYAGINLHMNRIKENVVIAAKHMDEPEGSKALNDILESVHRCRAEDV